MFAFATIAPQLSEGMGAAAVHGLKLVAVIVVAHAVVGMARQLTPDAPRALIAAGVAPLILIADAAWVQIAAIAVGGLLGLRWCRTLDATAFASFPVRYSRRTALVCPALFFAGLALALLWPSQPEPDAAALAAGFYQAGSLVFGGGHVVLALLQETVVDSGWMSAETFLTGYGAAQAVPGPMFSFAAFLGAQVALGSSPWIGAAIALLAVFVPGFLLLLAALPFWSSVGRFPWAASLMAGVNAAVVGLLAAALYNPVWTEGVRGGIDVAIVIVGFVALSAARISALWIVLGCVLTSMLVAVPATAV